MKDGYGYEFHLNTYTRVVQLSDNPDSFFIGWAKKVFGNGILNYNSFWPAVFSIRNDGKALQVRFTNDYENSNYVPGRVSIHLIKKLVIQTFA